MLRSRTMQLPTAFGLLLIFLAGNAAGQVAVDDSLSVDRGRLLGVSSVGVGVMGASLVVLDRAWYAQYERTSFHWFDDGPEWLQMDKAGHVFSCYWIGRWGDGLMQWSGVGGRHSAWIGAATGMVFMGGVEVLDGFSSGWGFSGWDMAANAAGTAMFLGQELGWGEQRIKLKLSASPTPFAQQRPDLLGRSLGERLLKDYNGQTVWLTSSVGAFAPGKGIWRAVGLGIGYGAEDMLSARAVRDDVGSSDPRSRQFFIGLDLDLERIPTRSRSLRTVFFLLNCIKLPTPAIELRDNGRILVHGLYF
ncbi:MAG: DUF2279 domain-containing protein [Flavobacteriales bacterium]|nr:DUF2279 domain-containing protein [Flavobacteriales bacterium]MCB9166386.1 DUF2279 domain-containing protein [Flavobacteriales bacterium]